MSGKRVLFVDDTESILFGYKRFCDMLYDESWRFFFASDGAEAIEIIESYSVDMVVTDLDMPFYDGVHLLDYIVRKVPEIIRVVVSGTTSTEKRVVVTCTAHQFFEKPAIPKSLKQMFSRVLYLDSILVSKETRDFVHQLGALPTLPQAFVDLQRESNDPNFSLKRCGEIIAKDPALSANILKVVNSSFFDIPNRVHSPEQAVSLLGIEMIRAFIVQDYFYHNFSKRPSLPLSVDKFSHDSFQCAKIAKHLARFEGESRQRCDEIYVASLLHNIGILIFNYHFPKRYGQVIRDASELEVSMSELEKRYIGATHEEVGAYILGLWGFEKELLEAVVCHHRPSKSPSGAHDLLDYIYSAEMLYSSIDKNYTGTFCEDQEYISFRKLLPKIQEWREISF